MNWVVKKLSDLAPFWVINECVKVWQRTKFFWLILGLSVRASLTDTSKPRKQKELLTFPTKMHNLHPSNIFTNLTPYSALTILSEISQTQLGRKALKTKSLFVLRWRHKQTEENVYVDSLKRSQKSKGVEKKEKRPVYLMFFFCLFSIRYSLCRQSFYLPFINASLILLAGRVSWRQSLSPSLWCFCRLRRAFEAAALLAAKASDRPMPSVRLMAK